MGVRTLRHLGLAAAWACALLAAALVVLYVLPEAQASTMWVAMAAAFIPYGILAWLASVALFASAGGRWSRLLAIPALIALIVQVGWARPYWPAPPPANPDGTPIRVLSANVRYGKADPSSLAGIIQQTDPDVVVIVEASEPFLESPAFAAALADRPHRVGRAVAGYARAGREDASGTMIISRLSLTEIGKLPSHFDQYVVSVGAGSTPLTLIAAHPTNMIGGAALWEREGAILGDGVRPHLAEPLAVVGDFNATPEHLTLRRLLDEGLTLGARQAGAGWQPTYTAVSGPALIPIDHVLTSERVTTRTFRTYPVNGSDHHAIVADLTYR